MSESRTELLAWYNDLSNSQYTKVEQFGSGAAHCFIMNSIYRDVRQTNKVPMSKVKMNAKHEWEYVANFKVLQATFDKHKVSIFNQIDNGIPVERLIKCKFQDNLEFLQWIKKFWDQYYPGGEYNFKQQTPKKVPVKVHAGSARAAARAAGPSLKNDIIEEYEKVAQELQVQVKDLKVTLDQVEKEREFYFGKLREIEVFVQNQLELVLSGDVEAVLKEVQGIMYKTEDGFEVPEAEV